MTIIKAGFEAHRNGYERNLLAPLRALTTDLNPLMLSIDQDLVSTPTRVISRIHRDTRFSCDKSPYKSKDKSISSESKNANTE